jgi:TRAP-type mannitol/chloroaromatic compound transport system substrate-binding protein
LAGAGLAAGAALGLAAPAVAQGIRQLTLVTDWPEGPGLIESVRRFAATVLRASDGRIRIEVSAAGAVVKPFQTFEAVENGLADMFHSHIGYFEKKSPAFHFFSAVPFGMTAAELFAWVRFGGGQQLWDELAAGFNIKPLLCSSTGSQMAGWFVREFNSVDDLRGLRYRMAGLGAEVYRRLGAVVVLLPGSEIVQALRSGAIDACEWIGPWLDVAMGLPAAAGNYYYPGWQEPSAGLSLGINAGVWESLPEADRQLIEDAASAEYLVSLAQFNTKNAEALAALREENRVRIRKIDDATLQTLAETAEQVVAEAGSGDALSRSIHDSFVGFRRSIRGWSTLGETSFLGIREAG